MKTAVEIAHAISEGVKLAVTIDPGASLYARFPPSCLVINLPRYNACNRYADFLPRAEQQRMLELGWELQTYGFVLRLEDD